MRAGTSGADHEQLCGIGTLRGTAEDRIGVAVFDAPFEACGVEPRCHGYCPRPLLVGCHGREAGVFEKADRVDDTDRGTERGRK